MIELVALFAAGATLADAVLQNNSGMRIFAVVAGIVVLIILWRIRAARASARRRIHLDFVYGTGQYDSERDMRYGSESKVGEHVRRAAELRKRGNHGKALSEIELAIQLEPRSADLQLIKAAGQHEAGRYNDALDTFAYAIHLDPGEPAAHIGAGITLRHLNRRTDALQSFAKALAIDSRNADAHTGMGRTLFELQDYVTALASFGRALELNPGDEYVIEWMARTQAALKQ